jgi:hypothetical protein
MGGLVSGITDTLSDVVGGVGDAAGGVLKAAAPYGSLIGAATGVPYGALLGGIAGSALGGAGTTPQSQTAYGNLFQGSLGVGGQLAQNRVSREAAQAAQQQALAGGQTAANMAAFRPVGTTTRFGTSAYSIDPATGGLKADYSLSPLAAGYQQSLADMTNQGLLQGQQIQGLAGQYLGESPEAVRQRYVEQQNALLAPQQEQQLAGIRNRLFQTGRGGLATGATEAGGLAATNPEMAAYYNALANQQRQIAAGADQAAQQQIQFGQQLAGQAYSPFTAGFGAQGAVEQAGQQPLTLAQDIARLQAASGAQQGQLYNQGAQRASVIGVMPEMQTSNAATLLGGLASPTSGLSGLFSGLGGNSNLLNQAASDWMSWNPDITPASTFGGYGDVSDLVQYGVF